MLGAPHLYVKSEGGHAEVTIGGQDATNGLRAMAITLQAGAMPTAMLEYTSTPEFEGLAQCTVNVVNPLRDVLQRVPLQRLREAVDMAGMGEHPADVVLDVLLHLVDDLETENAGVNPQGN